MATDSPGPRQTVDRAIHPALGEGAAVYDNGPAYFLADGGERVDMKDIQSGGFDKDGSYLVAVTTTGERVRLNLVSGKRGECHWRAVARVMGEEIRGWLVEERYSGEKRWAYRFEQDDGRTLRFDISAMWAGVAADGWRDRKGELMTTDPSKRKPSARDANCMTYLLTTDEKFTWCHERDWLPMTAPVAEPKPAKQMEMF